MSYVSVTLTPAEVTVAASIGMQRQIQALLEGRRHRFGDPHEAAWTRHIEGAAGEMAFAKAVNRYWQAPVGTYRDGGDVGDVQVRTGSRHDYDLLIRPIDRPDDVFVLVTGRCPHFRVHGWIRARDAQSRSEWLHERGGPPAAYFVPQSALRPLQREEATA